MTVYLDTYRIGTVDVYDARGILAPDGYAQRNMDLVTTVSIHHADTVALTADATMDDEVARLRTIERYHRNTKHWPGIAYPFVVFASGRAYYTGNYDRIRYVVGGDNNLETIAICLDGSFMLNPPPVAQQVTAASIAAGLRDETGIPLAVVPHKYYGGTSCPGDTWGQWKDIFTLPPLDPRSPEEVQLDVLWGLSAYLPDEQKAMQQAAIIALKADLGIA